MPSKYRINIEGRDHLVDVVEHSDRDYLITLGGKTFNAHIEDASTLTDGGPPVVTVLPMPVPVAAVTPASGERQVETVEPGQVVVVAPLTGTIIKMHVAVGSRVARGQLLCLVEAMKMETEIVSEHDAVVAEVAVANGQNVRQGQTLLVLGT